MSIAVVHLVWGPYGPEPLRLFLRSYAAFDAGREHALCILLNGVDDEAPVIDALAGVEHDVLRMTEPVQDLTAYRRAAERIEADRLVFLNTNAELLAPGWLAAFDAALDDPATGLAGATGSWETHLDSLAPVDSGAVARLRHAVGSRVTKPQRARRFGPYPNPHVRTSSFALDRELLLSLDWPEPNSKLEAHALESGKDGITRQVERRGLRAVVVGRDGRAYGADDWPESETFRSGTQANLLVADNRTRQYDEASAEMRRELRRGAWRGAVG